MHYHISLLKILSVIGDIYPKTLYNLCNTFIEREVYDKGPDDISADLPGGQHVCYYRIARKEAKAAPFTDR